MLEKNKKKQRGDNWNFGSWVKVGVVWREKSRLGCGGREVLNHLMVDRLQHTSSAARLFEIAGLLSCNVATTICCYCQKICMGAAESSLNFPLCLLIRAGHASPIKLSTSRLPAAVKLECSTTSLDPSSDIPIPGAGRSDAAFPVPPFDPHCNSHLTIKRRKHLR